jgi:hypothetical protein
MSLNSRIIQLSDLPEIIQFEKLKLAETISDEMEREIKSWNSRWREESLKHYLPMGWSFLTRQVEDKSNDEGKLVGYFIAQPLLFFDGHTQNLWVEHISYSTLQVRDELCEIAYKLAREKHFQKVFFPESQSIFNAVKNFKATNWDPQVLFANTTKV